MRAYTAILTFQQRAGRSRRDFAANDSAGTEHGFLETESASLRIRSLRRPSRWAPDLESGKRSDPTIVSIPVPALLTSDYDRCSRRRHRRHSAQRYH